MRFYGCVSVWVEGEGSIVDVIGEAVGGLGIDAASDVCRDVAAIDAEVRGVEGVGGLGGVALPIGFPLAPLVPAGDAHVDAMMHGLADLTKDLSGTGHEAGKAGAANGVGLGLGQFEGLPPCFGVLAYGDGAPGGQGDEVARGCGGEDDVALVLHGGCRLQIVDCRVWHAAVPVVFIYCGY